MRGSFVAGLVLAGVSVPGTLWAQAQTYGPAPAPDWTITIGAEGRVTPAYDGSDRYIVVPYPVFEIRRAGTPRNFTSPRDGFSIAIINLGQFRLGPTGKVVLPRDQSDYAALRGLGDVDWALEVGAFAEFWPWRWLRTRAEVRQGFGGHDGVVAELTADVVVPVTQTLTFSAGPRLTLASADALQPYFGVTPAQSIRSGLPVFRPDGGVRAFGLGAQVRQEWSREWATNLFVEYDRLSDDAARSPILTRRGSVDQVTVGIGLSYTFDVHLGLDLPF
jgi:outer membrane protein